MKYLRVPPGFAFAVVSLGVKTSLLFSGSEADFVVLPPPPQAASRIAPPVVAAVPASIRLRGVLELLRRVQIFDSGISPSRRTEGPLLGHNRSLFGDRCG